MRNEQYIRKLKKTYETRISEVKEFIGTNHGKHIKVLSELYVLKTKYENFLDIVQVVLGEKDIKDLS